MARMNDVQVAAGWDQSLSDSDNIESYTPASGEQIHIPGIGDVYCYVKTTLPEYSQGQARFSASGARSFAGLQQVRYFQELCHINTLSDLRANLEGQVTANLKTDSTTYAEYNCYLHFESEPYDYPDFVSVTWVFALVEAL